MILLADEDFDIPVVKKLREKGIDILTVSDLFLDNIGTPDEEILRVATEKGRAVLTFNRNHFRHLHKVQPQHAGIIICKRNTPVLILINLIAELVSSKDSLVGELHRIVQ